MRLFFAGICLMCLFFLNACALENKEIVFGQTGTFSGQLGLYGNLIKNSINACFKHVNESGGVNCLKLRLVSMEDNGDAVVARKNIKILLSKNIDMFLGCMGTRSILGLLPLIKDKKIAMLFPWSGHEFFRQRGLTNMINGLGYLQPQFEAIVKDIVVKRKFKKIAIFHADDEFSVQATSDLEKLLLEQNVKPVEVAGYNRMTIDIGSCAEKLLAADPKIVICISTSMPAAKLINSFFRRGHYATEFVGIDSTMFVEDLLRDKGVLFNYWASVPNPRLSKLKIAEQYRQDIDKYYPDDTYNVLSFAYYVSAEIVVQALKAIKGQVTKEKIIEQIEKMKNLDLGGFSVDFDENTRHAFGLVKTFRS
jgi:ABC-type branched-subunit amino acid transport system substrate-binding protein